MRGDLPLPAFRLLNALPVRTHERRSIMASHPQGSKNGRAITIHGIKYPSILSAKKTLHVSSETVYGWLATGKAVRS